MGLWGTGNTQRDEPRRAGRGKALIAAAFLSLPAMLQAQQFRERLPEDEVVYFVLPDRFENGDAANDRGGIKGTRLDHGFDPTHKGFYLGGDLKGLTARLDYIQTLGATAIWLGPIYKNKPVQGPSGEESAGYHGYWITDFTQVDPHFGTRAEMKTFVEAAHARGMKVYLDIITNHTADVIQYAECPASACAYRSRADYPYTRRSGPDGPAINPGFAGDTAEHQTAENFSKLTRPDFAYTPVVPAKEKSVKVPAWLNDPIWYHNRGNTTFKGENSQFGDFVGLDDLMTENPRVVQGFIDIYGAWIDEFGVDGFRIDTARHVNPEFWQAFVPAMIERARAKGIPNFHIFGEIATDQMDPGYLARFTRVDRLPSVLDFAFQRAAIEVLTGKQGTERLNQLYEGDALYEGGADAARRLPTFLGNHDNGRIGWHLRSALPQTSDAEMLKRVTLGHALMFFGRGVPVVYYGDEQGFAGDGGDQDARETMFAGKVASYNDNRLTGSDSSTAAANFNPAHPLYRAISEMAGIRARYPALRRGTQRLLSDGSVPGLFAFSRRLESGDEIVVAFNTGNTAITARLAVDPASTRWTGVKGQCGATPAAPGSYNVTISPLDYVICAATRTEEQQ